MFRLAVAVVLALTVAPSASAQTQPLSCPGCRRNADCLTHYGSEGTCIAGRCSNEGSKCPLRCPACRTDDDCAVSYGSAGTCTQGRCSNQGANCCATLYGPGGVQSRTCSADMRGKVPQSQRNILFVISDDIGYCHAGFMVTRGVCANTNRLCSSPADCSGQPCQFEITCRNRKPGLGKDAGSFPYERSEVSSAGFPVITPFLDQLAEQGAVFPRAHVAASICTSSRQTFLTGRYQRHSSYLVGGDGKSECVSSDTKLATHPALGCRVAADCGTGATCAKIRAMPNELKEAADKLGITSVDAPYMTLGAGKTEFIARDIFDSMPEHRKKPGVGKFHCTDTCGGEDSCGSCAECTRCREDLAADRIPSEAAADLDEVTSFIDEKTFGAPVTPVTTTTLPSSEPAPRPVQNKPFFIWYGPNIPHDGSTADPFFRAKYDAQAYNDLAQTEKSFFARVSWMDFGVRTIADHLQRTCTCSQDEGGSTFSWKPLYDSTVVIYAGGDQGFEMPNAKHNHTENGHRMALIVSDPRHRRNALTPRAFPGDFAATPDILPTVLAYAGVSPTLLTSPTYSYDYGRNLKPWIDGTNTGPIREFQYSEKGASGIPTKGGAQYVINRFGKVGVCTTASTITGHKLPCIANKDCNGTGPCIASDQPNGRRCINRPEASCTTDAECAVGLCNGSSQCAHVENVSYKELQGTTCTSSGIECVPAGVCRPIMLKAEAPPGGKIKSVWDVNWTPDQHDYENLLKLKLPGQLPKVDPNYIGPCLKAEMQQCLYKFRAYDSFAGGAALPDPGDLTNCPAISWCP